MGVKFSNNASTTLSASITAGATSADVVDASEFPAVGGADYAYLTLVSGAATEIVKVTDITGSTLTIERAQDGTTASAFTAGDRCELRLTTALLTDALAEKEAVDATILKDVDIGVTVQAYSAINALLSDITYELLDTNGDVGTGAGQLAIGDHTHSDLDLATYDPAGIAEQLVGLIAEQTLTYKTIDSPTNIVHADATYTKIRNESGSTLLAGTPVYSTGYNTGQDRTTVNVADANVAASMPAIGLIEEDLANNTDGKALESGTMNAVDTSTYAVNDPLYVSEVAGELTNVRPTDKDSDVQKIATVLRVHATAGRILVHGASRSNALPNSATAEAGFATKSYNIGNTGAGTITPLILNGNSQYATCTGAFTLAAPTDINEGWMEIEITVDGTGGYSPDLTTNFNNISGTFDATANKVNLCRIHKAKSGTCYLEITQKV